MIVTIVIALFVKCFRGAQGPGRAVAMSSLLDLVLASTTSGLGCNTRSQSRTSSMLHIQPALIAWPGSPWTSGPFALIAMLWTSD